MAPTEVYEVTHALDSIRLRAEIPSSEFRLLTYVIEQMLGGNGHQLSQKTIAADVFGRDLRDFEPRADSIVRTTAAHLRESLLAYYAGPGHGDPVMIEIPRGAYVPRLSRRPSLSASMTGRLFSARMAIEARTPSSYETAARHLDAVLSEAPDSSLALALKAECLASRAIHGARPRPLLEEAGRLAERAADQPKPAWQAWLAMGMVQQALHWNWSGARESYSKALEMSEGDAATHVWYTAYLVGRGRPEEGISNLRRTVDHFGYCNPTFIGDLSMLLILARDYDAAAESIDAAIEASPAFYQHHMNKAILLEARGDAQGALRVLDRTPLRLLERPVTWGLRALLAGLSGSPAVARRRISWFRTIQKAGRYIPPSQFAACWLGAGNVDEAIQCLENAAEDRDPLVVWFHAYPFFRHLHGHARFRHLIDRIGLVWF